MKGILCVSLKSQDYPLLRGTRADRASQGRKCRQERKLPAADTAHTFGTCGAFRRKNFHDAFSVATAMPKGNAIFQQFRFPFIHGCFNSPASSLLLPEKEPAAEMYSARCAISAGRSMAGSSVLSAINSQEQSSCRKRSSNSRYSISPPVRPLPAPPAPVQNKNRVYRPAQR